MSYRTFLRRKTYAGSSGIIYLTLWSREVEMVHGDSERAIGRKRGKSSYHTERRRRIIIHAPEPEPEHATRNSKAACEPRRPRGGLRHQRRRHARPLCVLIMYSPHLATATERRPRQCARSQIRAPLPASGFLGGPARRALGLFVCGQSRCGGAHALAMASCPRLLHYTRECRRRTAIQYKDAP